MSKKIGIRLIIGLAMVTSLACARWVTSSNAAITQKVITGDWTATVGQTMRAKST